MWHYLWRKKKKKKRRRRQRRKKRVGGWSAWMRPMRTSSFGNESTADLTWRLLSLDQETHAVHFSQSHTAASKREKQEKERKRPGKSCRKKTADTRSRSHNSLLSPCRHSHTQLPNNACCAIQLSSLRVESSARKSNTWKRRPVNAAIRNFRRMRLECNQSLSLFFVHHTARSASSLVLLLSHLPLC